VSLRAEIKKKKSRDWEDKRESENKIIRNGWSGLLSANVAKIYAIL
jgi:hypothetical protein